MSASLKNKLFTGFAAAAVVGSLGVAGMANSQADGVAQADEPTTITMQASAAEKAPVILAEVTDAAKGEFQQVAAISSAVTLLYGRGFNPVDAQDTAHYLTNEGCPASAAEGGRPNRLKVITNGQKASFKDSGSAAVFALDHCK